MKNLGKTPQKESYEATFILEDDKKSKIDDKTYFNLLQNHFLYGKKVFQ